MSIFSTHPDRLHPASSVYRGLFSSGVMWPGCEGNHSHLVSRSRIVQRYFHALNGDPEGRLHLYSHLLFIRLRRRCKISVLIKTATKATLT